MVFQYSVHFCVAVALVDDVDDPLAFGERALRDGRTLERANDDFLGTPTRPLSSAQLKANFLRCAGAFAHAESLLEQLEAITSVPDVAALPLG